jgi:hypothetical protein
VLLAAVVGLPECAVSQGHNSDQEKRVDMQKSIKSTGRFPASGVGSFALFNLLLASQILAAPAAHRPEAASRPVKLAITATVSPVGDGATADVAVSLRDAENKSVVAPGDLTVRIEAREFSGVQRLSTAIKAGSESARCSFPLHEGGIIEFWASHAELRPDTTFVRLKPFAPSSQPAPGYTPNSVSGTGAPDTHLGKEVAKVGQTAKDIGNTAKSFQDTIHQLGSFFGSIRPGSDQPAFLAGSQDRRYLADGQDAAIIQVFLGQPASKKTEIQLQSSGGKLDPPNLMIDAGKDTGQTRLTSDKTGPVVVSFAKALPKIKLPPTNTLDFRFTPPIVRLNVRASPPQITLLETAELVVQLQDAHGETVATDEPRSISTAIVQGLAVIQSPTNVIPAGKFETRFVFCPTRSGVVGVKAFADNLPAELGEVRVSLPVMLLSLSAVGGSLGGLLAAFHAGLPAAVRNGPLRRRLKNLPWWRMSVGLVTGFVLYWAFIFLSLGALPRAVLLNPFTALVSSLLGGWLGLNVFTLVLKRLHLSKGEGPMSGAAPERPARA